MDEQMLNQILVTQADKYPYMSLLNLKSQILNSGIDPTTLQMMMAQAKDPILSTSATLAWALANSSPVEVCISGG